MIVQWFRSMKSFGDKVTWLVTLTSGAAIIGVSVTLALVDFANLRRETLAGLESQVMIVAMNSSAPLAFADKRNATEALSALQARQSVASAYLYDVNGNLFARYRRFGEVAPADALGIPAGQFVDRWYKLVAPVEEQGEMLGRIEVVYDTRPLQQHLLRSLLLSTAVSLLAVLLVYLFSLRINQVLTKPIALLSRTAREVSETGDYTLRAQKISDDELGGFTDAFNQMLQQIQKQDLEIHASRAEALHASRLKDEFLATLSHELRTPMTPILGWAQILQRSSRDPQVTQAAEVIERNARAQNRIIDDLLDMSRIISGKVRLDIQEIDVAHVVTQALDTVQAAAQARAIGLEHDLPPGIGLTRGDPHRLQQVIWNLLSNAIKFTGAGGLVRISMRRVADTIEIIVSDSGQGIPSEFLPHVFERFRQADSSNTRMHAGLGLGLAIVKQLVELHGGQVHVASPGAGEGATFTVALPALSRQTDRPAEVRQPNAASATALLGLRLLLVDDESDARQLVEHLLRSLGAVVLGVDSARAAVSAMASFRPDALLSDIGMPGESGYDLIRVIRGLPVERGGAIPAIALTAFARPEDSAKARLAGFQLHLAKPVELVDLLEAVVSLTGGERSPQA